MNLTKYEYREHLLNNMCNYRESWTRPRPREYRAGIRDRGYSPSMEPAPKRIRHDYYGGEGYYNHYGGGYHPPAHR